MGNPKGLNKSNSQADIKSLNILHEGWVLKKKRKKMQGYAKRYLILTKEGILTYSISPDKPTRDSIEIPHASVISSQHHGTIHVDSGSSVFHLKMLNPQDFSAWRSQLKSFIPERSSGQARRIYVVTDDSTDLMSVDLNPLFTASDSMNRLVAEIKKQSALLARKRAEKGVTGEVLNMFSWKNEEAELNATLQTLIDSLAAEHANFQHVLESRVPRVFGGEGMMSSIKSRVQGDGRYAQSRHSISSFATNFEDDAIFYDADAADNTDIADEPETSSRDVSSAASDASASEEGDDDDSGDENATEKGVGNGKFRTRLPAKVSGDEVSLFSMLKKNVGKDLSTISFPVSFNCPLSLLQAAAEEYEYAPKLLERAGKTEDWIQRLCLVGAWAVSSYSSTKLRASRKPFNPLLGETFELYRNDGKLKFIAEKVVHQPPVVATYAEGNGWKAYGCNSVKNKFWGKSLELIPDGSLKVELADGDIFSFKKPSSFMRNLLAGNKYLEHVGELTVTNESTGARLAIDFKEGNMWGGSSSRNLVAGFVYNNKGEKVTEVKGRWSDNFAIQKDKENYQVLWEANEMPPNSQDHYGFTYFAMSLNEITKDMEPFLPCTDSRLRPDQRALEEGKVDEAEETKLAVEGAQRERRKKREAEGKVYKPLWFHKQNDDVEWQYGAPGGHEYFKKRAEVVDAGPKKAKDVWGDLPEIFTMQKS
ncbi:hypothetical protein K437DRAFT_254097 [Tilletiaria anomala UBC 951]|uniref:PH domain-containing protein n=1 Tax=Tilletiaria anomala (strain ATCC 24038 / CBS 436.72 / UBC 951) TaxID=1037660 RepID=A0A066WPG1_TILAU|nr:uncharacterized protein K437DRAFT_254097 [Tilletiaria anomala UBC 951]KDN52515.1 hypothetical protein K437DRAFT_254097 [Tilletiaria anomala UBC 951]